MKTIAHALHPNALRGASHSQELPNTPKGEMKMTKIVNFAAAIVVVLPIAAVVLLQAAQIVA
jgi:hypothetical protein